MACCAPPVLLAVDFAVLSVTVPELAADLDMTRAQTRWLFSAYSLAFGCLLLPAGRAADGFGRRRLLIAGLGIFGAGAAVTALAGNGSVVIAGRALEGAGAATMTPAALALLTATAPEGADRSRALAAYGLAISTGFVIGSLLSGVIATLTTWRIAIAALVPLTIAAILAAARSLPRDASPDIRASGGTPAIAVAGLVAVAALSAAEGSPAGALLAIGAAIGLLAMAARLARAAAGRGARMALACAAGLVVTGTGAAATLLLTLYLQDVRGYTPLGAALVFACFGAAAVPGAEVARRMPAGRAMGAGLAMQGAGLLMAVALAGSGLAIVASVAGFGFGHVIGNASVAAVATAGTAVASHGAIVGMLVTAQYLGGTLGPALLGRASFEVGMATAGAIALVSGAAAWWGDAAT